MSISADSSTSSGHPPLTSRVSMVSVIDNMGKTPFARPRKLSRNLSTISNSALTSMIPPTNPAILVKRPSQVQVTRSPSQANTKVAGASGTVLTSPTESGTNRSTLPALTESRRMNLTDVVIWRRFTRALKQRVEERKTEKRTFCWLDRSMSSSDGKRRTVASLEYEPSYRMEPSRKPRGKDCKELLDEYLEEKLRNVEYEAEMCGNLSKQMSDEIRQKIKQSGLLPPRYKCIAYVVLGEKKEQGIRVCSMSAWDKNTDNYISSSYQNTSIFCVVTLFAVYLE